MSSFRADDDFRFAGVERRITRREFHCLVAATGASLLLTRAGVAEIQSAFVHPGILHSAVDLERMRSGVRQKLWPIAAGFDQLCDHPLSKMDYAHHNFDKERELYI